MSTKPTRREYRAKNGKLQFKPSIEFTMLLAENNEGFCLACGHNQEDCEPDARRYKCDRCDAEKVYGAEEIAMMGLTF